MSTTFVDECVAVLTRTPATLNAQLRDLPESWTEATEGPGTWSPYVVVGHLINSDKAAFLPRLLVVLEQGSGEPFTPFDREAQFRESAGKSLSTLLDEFSALRSANLETLRGLHLQPRHLELQAIHPAFGLVTARQLLATWTAHDLAHLLQINRVMARRYAQEVGPWAEYLSVMKQ